MISAKPASLTLAPFSIEQPPIAVACINIFKRIPTASDELLIICEDEQDDTDLGKLIRHIGNKSELLHMGFRPTVPLHLLNIVQQFALWIVTDNPDEDRLALRTDGFGGGTFSFHGEFWDDDGVRRTFKDAVITLLKGAGVNIRCYEATDPDEPYRLMRRYLRDMRNTEPGPS
jgi:hypothetical protein